MSSKPAVNTGVSTKRIRDEYTPMAYLLQSGSIRVVSA